MKKLFITPALLLSFLSTQAQEKSSVTEKQISETIMLYIDGTANGQPEKLKQAFHPDFNLYSVNNDESLRIWKGADYIGNIKTGEKTNRMGQIISIDYENNVATAKTEIVIPGWRIFTDYFLLVKYDGAWKIIHKSYTWKEYTEAE